MAKLMNVDVCYALPTSQALVAVELPEGASVQQVIDASGLLQTYPEINLANQKVGVFAKLVKLDTILRDGDRVEIYRPLIADPKEVRRQRALAGKAMKKGGR